MADLIIILLYCGERPVRKTKEIGTFFCPVCMKDQPFKQKELWSYCHMYYIPLLPADHLVDYVKCSSCKTRFDPSILEHGPKDLETALNTAMLRAMVRVMAADGSIQEKEVDEICKIYEERSGTKIDQDGVLAQWLIMKELNGGSLATDLRPFARVLSTDQKESVVSAMVAVSLADGELDIEEAKLVQQVGKVLGVEFSRVKEILQAEYNRRSNGENAVMKNDPGGDADETNSKKEEFDNITHGETDEEEENVVVARESVAI